MENKKLNDDNTNSIITLQNAEVQNRRVYSRFGRFSQLILMAFVALNTGSCGLLSGFSAILVPQLRTKNETIIIDDETVSWIVSAGVAAAPIGSLSTSVVTTYLGRKGTAILSSIFNIISWIIIQLATSAEYVIIGRLISGVGVGLAITVGQIYLAEASKPSMRGIMNIIASASFVFGILVVYILGSIFDWRLIAGLNIIPIATNIAVLLLLKESPIWLFRKGRTEQAQKAFKWFRNDHSTKNEEELQQLMLKVKVGNFPTSKGFHQTRKALCVPESIKPFVIINIFNFLQTFCGIYLLVYYAVEIISKMGITNVNDYFCAILTAGIRLICIILTSYLMKTVKRRNIILGSALGTAISAYTISALIYFSNSPNGYLICTWLLLYIAASTTGLFIFPSMMIGEYFPAKSRDFLGSSSYCLYHIYIFGISKLFPYLNVCLKIHEIFLLFAISASLITAFVYYALPETKDLTLTEIEEYFKQDNIAWIRRNRNKRIPQSDIEMEELQIKERRR